MVYQLAVSDVRYHDGKQFFCNKPDYSKIVKAYVVSIERLNSSRLKDLNVEQTQKQYLEYFGALHYRQTVSITKPK